MKKGEQLTETEKKQREASRDLNKQVATIEKSITEVEASIVSARRMQEQFSTIEAVTTAMDVEITAHQTNLHVLKAQFKALSGRDYGTATVAKTDIIATALKGTPVDMTSLIKGALYVANGDSSLFAIPMSATDSVQLTVKDENGKAVKDENGDVIKSSPVLMRGELKLYYDYAHGRREEDVLKAAAEKAETERLAAEKAETERLAAIEEQRRIDVAAQAARVSNRATARK